MNAWGYFDDLRATFFEWRAGPAGKSARRPMDELCEALLSGRGEVSGMRLARDILARYQTMSDDEHMEFFRYLRDRLDLDVAALGQAVAAYAKTPDHTRLAKLNAAAQTRRQELFRRLNQAPGGTADLVRMRLDLLSLAAGEKELMRIDLDFAELFTSWFNRGFLVLRPINWHTPANILEKIIQYEAVHAIHDWRELRRRLEPPDRRCFAFFHPAMPDEPLIFVEVALAKGIPGSIQEVLAEGRAALDPAQADTAVFYSISNCQEGLRGISFGNSLIKQVVEELSHEVPHLKNFVTLSPVPGLARWLKGQEDPRAAALLAAAGEGDLTALGAASADLRRLAASYLVEGKRPDGTPLDPVARFHLGNGALVHDVHAMADTSVNGLAQSCGAMVNYLYALDTVELNHEAFATRQEVITSKVIRAVLKMKAEKGRKAVA